MVNPLLLEKHERYFRFCLDSFPAKAQSEDSNKLALIYFCLHGLGLLKKLDFTEREREKYSNYIYDHLISNEQNEIQSFRPSQTFKLPENCNEYDFPNLSATFFALASLLALKSDYSKRIDRHKVMHFLQMLQIQSGTNKGSFNPVLDGNKQRFGETDLRFCYIAACIRKLLKYDTLPSSERIYDIDVEGLTNFVLSRVNYDGGMSSYRHTESHAGLTFCGLACLGLLEYNFENEWVEDTLNWLVHRQVDYPQVLYEQVEYDYYDEEDIGGFNGRENKFSDTCYSWWVTGSLMIIGRGVSLVDVNKGAEYLLTQTQHNIMGGFSKDGEQFPDPLHTFLGLASLSLWKKNGLDIDDLQSLDDIDELLVITSDAKKFFESSVY